MASLLLPLPLAGRRLQQQRRGIVQITPKLGQQLRIDAVRRLLFVCMMCASLRPGLSAWRGTK